MSDSPSLSTPNSVTTEDAAPASTACRQVLGIWREPALWLLLGMVLALYLWRIPQFPIHGEESRWAGGATEMLRTGDWVVPRQQGQPFPERPPMNSWLMALLGWCFGEINVWAIRLPSVFAIAITSGILYLYSRQFLPVLGAFAAGAIYATFGQVLQIGRLGESEAVLAMFVTAAVLTWHTGYLQGWPRLTTWTLACLFAAGAALTKGLQGPVYLLAVSGCYLLYRREWRWIFSWEAIVGVAVGATVVALWQVPFFWATDAQAVKDIWTGLVMDRVTWGGLAEHLVSYPLETLGCLLPWSLLLVQLAQPRFRRDLTKYAPVLQYVVLATVLSYPSVWFVTGARGRYFMPLYGCLAVILACIAQVSMDGAVGSWAQRGWLRLVRGAALVLVPLGLLLTGVALIPAWDLGGIDFAWPTAAACLLAAIVLAAFSWQRATRFDHSLAFRQLACFAICLGLAYLAVAPQLVTRHGHHVRAETQAIRAALPAELNWRSFGPVHHRFVYHLGQPVDQLPWPSSTEELPADLEYFALDYNIRDTEERRFSGRGRSWTTTPGKLPFAWEEIARIPMERSYEDSTRWVIIGRVIRSEQLEAADAVRTIARQPGETK